MVEALLEDVFSSASATGLDLSGFLKTILPSTGTSKLFKIKNLVTENLCNFDVAYKLILLSKCLIKFNDTIHVILVLNKQMKCAKVRMK
jgi:hypothetical protein